MFGKIFGKNVEERKEFVNNYQFTPATLQTFEKLSGIDPQSDKGQSIQKALKQYYMLHVTKESDEMIGMPSLEIDHLWHAHILDTREYHDFCENAFGSYLHHQPFVKGQDTETEKKANEVLVQRAREEGHDDLMNWIPAFIIADMLLDDDVQASEPEKEEDNRNTVGDSSGAVVADTTYDSDHSSHSTSDSSSSSDSSYSSCGGSSSCGGGCGGGCGA